MYKTIGKKILVFLLIFSTLISFSISNAAEIVYGSEREPYYINCGNTNSEIKISGIKATCSTSLRVNKSMALSIKMEIQKKKSSGYETLKTWTGSKTGTYLTMSESRNINLFSDYRLKVTFTAGSETETTYAYPK